MPAWTSESTVVKSSWIVAAGRITGEGIAGTNGGTPWPSKSRPCLDGADNEMAMRAGRRVRLGPSTILGSGLPSVRFRTLHSPPSNLGATANVFDLISSIPQPLAYHTLTQQPITFYCVPWLDDQACPRNCSLLRVKPFIRLRYGCPSQRCSFIFLAGLGLVKREFCLQLAVFLLSVSVEAKDSSRASWLSGCI